MMYALFDRRRARFSKDELTAIRAIVLTDDYRRLRNQHTNYYMVGNVKERLEGEDYDLGNMYLRASREAESERPPLVQQYQALAIANYDAFLKRDSTRSKDWWYATVVAAELDRLLGHFDAVEIRLKDLPGARNERLSTEVMIKKSLPLACALPSSSPRSTLEASSSLSDAAPKAKTCRGFRSSS